MEKSYYCTAAKLRELLYLSKPSQPSGIFGMSATLLPDLCLLS